MLVFESLDDIFNYTYTYPVEEWVMHEFRKRFNRKQTYFEFVEQFALDHITYGNRRYGEFEDGWRHLKLMLAGQLYNFKHRGIEFPYRQMLILLDQYLVLDHDGQPIPNLLK